MPVINDPETEMSHLRRLCLQYQGEISTLAAERDMARREREAAVVEARGLRGEVIRLESDLRAERKRRRVCEESLRIANESLNVHRHIEESGSEVLARALARANGLEVES